MSTNHTPNYQLSQWEPGDQVLRADFNADNAKIDAALSAASFGNCRIAVGSYVGTGEYGASHPNILTFDFYPKVIFLDTSVNYSSGTSMNYLILTAGVPRFGYFNGGCVPTWAGKSVSWYTAATSGDRPAAQFNVANRVYHYIVLGAEEE